MNMKEEIKKQLTEWFSIMLAKYTWLEIKYEYNLTKECYLVSFYVSSDIENSDFDKDVLEFEEKMDNTYGDYSPLFCDNERLFKMSPNAILLTNCTYSTFTRELSDKMACFDLQDTFVLQNTNTGVHSGEFCYDNQQYDMAA